MAGVVCGAIVAASGLSLVGQASGTVGRAGVPPTVVTDSGIRSEPATPALPPAGGTFVDPVFGTTILRVTDERDGPGNQVPYSYWPTFNRDSTQMVVGNIAGEGFLYDFDPVGMVIGDRRPLWAKAPVGGAPFVEDAIWSGVRSNVIYAHSATRLWAYDVARRRFTLLRDFTGTVPGLWQMSRSIDDRVFCFTRVNRRGNYEGWICWRRDTDQVITRRQSSIDEIKVDKSGRYAHVALTRSGAGVVEGQVVNLRTGRIAGLRDDAPDFNPGHADMGRNLIVGAENWRNRILARRLSRPHRPWSVIGFGSDWSQDFHVSLLEDSDRWVVVSAYVASAQPDSGRFRNEIFAVSTDEKRRLRRLAHHHSIVDGYAASPRANVSRDGRFVAFTSNWGGTARLDVFVVRIPDGALAAPPGQLRAPS